MSAHPEAARRAARRGRRCRGLGLGLVIGLLQAAVPMATAPASASASASASALPTAAADPAPPALGELMRRLALARHRRATFVERQYLALLDRPLESSGELRFDAPDRLEKRTLAPQRETLILDHGEIEVRRGNRRYELALRDVPQLAPFVDSLRATLAGDLGALERSYTLNFATRGAGWTLELVPRDAKSAAVVASIRIAGSADRIDTVEIRRADGDHSSMTIQDLAAR